MPKTLAPTRSSAPTGDWSRKYHPDVSRESGATIKTPTLKGEVDLRIPPGSATGTRLRLRGRGLPGSPPGDQIVTIAVDTPAATTEEQKDLCRRMAQSFDFDPRARNQSDTP